MPNKGVPVNLDREGRKEHIEFHKDLEVNASQLKDAGEFAQEQGNRAKEYSDNIETVMQDGPVQTVNGKTGQVTGLAEQTDLEEVDTRLDTKIDTVNTNLDTKIDGGLNSVNTQLAQTEQELDGKKADRTELQTGLSSKVGKGENESVSWGMLDQEAKENMSDGQVAVVGENSVNRVNLVNGAATFEKRSRLGEMATIMFGFNTPSKPNLDMNSLTLKFSDTFFVSSGKIRFNVSGGAVIDLGATESTGVMVYFNTATQALIARPQTHTSVADENDLLVSTVSFDENRTKVLSMQMNCEFTIDCLEPSVYFLRNNPDFTAIIPSTGLAVTYLGSTSEYPEYDEVNRTLTFYSTFFILYGNKRYSVPDGVVIDVSHLNSSSIAFHYNIKTGEFYTNDTRFLQDLPETAVLFAILYLGPGNAYEFKGLYITCPYTVNGEFPFTNGGGSAPPPSNNKPYVFAQEPLIGNYTSSGFPAGDGTDPDGFDHRTVMHTDIYAAYDDLVSKFPNYVTKVTKGMDTSGTIPINHYYFTPTQVNRADRPKPLPKEIIASGAHGDGWMFHNEGLGDGSSGDPPTSVFALYYFMKDVCENWQESSLLEYVRWNAELVIVPLQNPWGFDNRSRFNSRGVDMNRNYDYGWNEEVSAEKGTSPFSEKETQYMRDLINENKDAIHFSDYHTISDSNRAESDLQDIRVNHGGEGIYMANHSIGKVSRHWKGRYNLDDLDFYGRIGSSPNTLRPVAKNWAEFVAGINSVTIESFPTTEKMSLNSEPIINMNVEFIGNWIINVLRYYQNN